MIAVIIAYILLRLACCLQGVIDAILYSGKSKNAFKRNTHIPLVSMRIMWLILFFYQNVAFYFFDVPYMDIRDMAFMVVSFICTFSFWHNGAYGITKLKIEAIAYFKLYGYKKYTGTAGLIEGFTHVSPTDESKVHFDFASRSWAEVGAIALIVIHLFVRQSWAF